MQVIYSALYLPDLKIPQSFSTLNRAHTISSNHWVEITTWTNKDYGLP